MVPTWNIRSIEHVRGRAEKAHCFSYKLLDFQVVRPALIKDSQKERELSPAVGIKALPGLILSFALLAGILSASCSRYDALPGNGEEVHPSDSEEQLFFEDGDGGGDDDGGPAHDADTGLLCSPECPDGSECRDLDGLGEPECLLPSGRLACVDDRHCPVDGRCSQEGTCRCRYVGCASDEDCAVSFICVDEYGSCGLCMPFSYFACEVDDDCALVFYLSKCCPEPVIRNISVLDGAQCMSTFPPVGEPPAGCEPDCSGIDHCWPIPSETARVCCVYGSCTMHCDRGI